MYRSKSLIPRLPVKQSSLEVPPILGTSRESRSTMRSRASSTSRVSALSTAETPAFRRSKSSQSLRPTPQSGLRATSCGSRQRSTERAKYKTKDSRPLQDKKWQQQQVMKVQDYIQRIPGGSQKLNKGTSIRPMTLAMFVDLCQMLMFNIDPRLTELTLVNYTDQLQTNLTLLMYPGVVTRSTLKTANAMHSWPHVLGILSWLVELRELEDIPIEETLFQVPEDAPIPYQICKFKWQTVMDSFVAWNSQQTDVNVEQTYDKGLKTIFNIPEGLAQSLRDENSEKKLYLSDLKEAVDRKKKCMEEAQHKLKAIKQDMHKERNIYSQQIEYNNKMKDTLADRKQNIGKLKQAIDKVQHNQTVLKEKIATQPMTRRERSEKLLQIEDLKAKLVLRQQTRAQQQQISDEKDLKLSQLKRQVEQKINAHNNSLMKPALSYPALRDLTLPEDGFMRSDIRQLIAEKIQKKEALALALTKENEELDKEIAGLKRTFENLQRQMGDTEMIRSKKVKAVQELKLRLATLKETAHDQEQTAQGKIQELQQEIQQLSTPGDHPDYRELIPQLNALREKCDWWKNAIEAEQQKFLAFFRSLAKEVDEYIPKLQGIREKIDEAVGENNIPGAE